MTDFLLLAFIFLIAGVFSVPIASRLGLGSVLGYLIAGICISPLLRILHVDVVSIQHFAEFGVVMMLFLVGLELEPKILWEMRAKLLGLGGAQVSLTTGAVTVAAMALGQPWSIALAIGLVFALSSTAIVLQTLGEKGLMKSDGGQGSFSVLLFQDIAVIPMLALIPLLAIPEITDLAQNAAHGAGSEEDAHGAGLSLIAGLNAWQTTLVTIGAVAFVAIGGNYLTGPIFRFIAGAQLRELFTAAALMIVIGIALLMSLVGLSPALGTFLAGVVLANSPYRHELESDIEPFKGLLLGLFFMTVGASVDFPLLFANLGSIIGLTLGLIAIKAGVLFILGTVFGLSGSDRWLFALGLAQAGEFGFVLLSFTVGANVIPSVIADQLLLVVALSMLLTPALFILYDRVLAPRFSDNAEREADEMPENSHIIIAGHGRVGGLVSRILQSAGYAPTVVDFSSKQLDMLSKFGIRAYYGDATRPDMLHSAGIDQAKMLVVAIDGKEAITELVTYVTQTYPHVHVVARATDRNHVYDLWAAGCRDIVRETYDSSLRMGRSSLEALGASRDQAMRACHAFDAQDRRVMLEMAEHYDPALSIEENENYTSRVRERNQQWKDEVSAEMTAILQERVEEKGA